MIKSSRNEHLVGVLRKDGTPYKLLSDEILREMMLKWIKGKEIEDLCLEYHITRIQFHRQKYHKERVLSDIIEKVRQLVAKDYNSKQIGPILKMSYKHVNIIISTML